MVIEDRARQIVKRILWDLQDRRGPRQVWEEMDVLTQADVTGAWEKIVTDEMLAGRGDTDA
jgi:hypothetical protein